MDDRYNKANILENKFMYMSDDEICELSTRKFKPDEFIKWGETGTININKIKVFYKKLPLAKLFYESGICTSNLYNLPAYYNYGYGSAGINPWRELVTQVNLSNWVKQGHIENFPLVYHWRIIKDKQKNFHSGLDEKLMKRYGSNSEIKKYLEDRYNCEYKIIILMEFIPYVLYEYIKLNPNDLEKYFNQSNKILDFLQSKGILDLDAHWGNYLVDSLGKLYLTDFGLVLDKNFDLTKNEIKFFNANKKLPYYYFFENIYTFVRYISLENNQINKLFNEEFRKKVGKITFVKIFIKSIDHVCKILKLQKKYAEIIKSEKNKIIKTIELKDNFSNGKNKDIHL